MMSTLVGVAVAVTVTVTVSAFAGERAVGVSRAAVLLALFAEAPSDAGRILPSLIYKMYDNTREAAKRARHDSFDLSRSHLADQRA